MIRVNASTSFKSGSGYDKSIRSSWIGRDQTGVGLSPFRAVSGYSMGPWDMSMARVFKVVSSRAVGGLAFEDDRPSPLWLKCFTPSVPLQDVHGQINSVDFHRTSDFLIAGHDQGYITYYNTVEGRRLGILDCSKYGVSNAVFTHHVKSVLHASGKVRIGHQN